MKIISQSTINGKRIDRHKLIDRHYYAIASKATILTADEISILVPKAEFQKNFGESWDKVLGEGRVGNAV